MVSTFSILLSPRVLPNPPLLAPLVFLHVCTVCILPECLRSNWRKTVSSLTSVQLEGNTGEGQDSTKKSAQHAADSAPRVLAHLCSWGWHEQTQHQGSWAHLCSWGFTLWLQKVSILLQPRKKLYQQPRPLVKALTTPNCNCLLTHPSSTLDCDFPEG